MNIIEVKNNLVKLCYEEDLTLSGLLLIKDGAKSYIAQILHLEATRAGKVAIAKIIFNYNNGLFAYDGSIPHLRSEIEVFPSDKFLAYTETSEPVILGKLSNSNTNFSVNLECLKENPIILSEKFHVTKVLLNNIAVQLQARKEKLIVFDNAGIFKNNRLTFTKDFKLPLNSSSLNYIYNSELADATSESKAMIQSIFEELDEYSKTVEYIPFDLFKSVIDAEFERTKLMQLVILKNKIKQIRDLGVFAQDSSSFKILKTKLESANTLVIDISGVKPALQKECIKYVYSILKSIDSEYYVFTPLSGEGEDTYFIRNILGVENIHTTLICDYDYANLNELKKSSKNILMFTPLKQQKDYGGYNVLLQKLSEEEFVAYGKITKFVPMICRMAHLSMSDVYIPKPVEEVKVDNVAGVNVDTPTADEPTPQEGVNADANTDAEETAPQEGVTVDETANTEEVNVDTAATTEVIDNDSQEESEESDAPESDEALVTAEKEESTGETSSDEVQEDVQINTLEQTPIEEIQTPEVNMVEAPEVEVEVNVNADVIAEEPTPQEGVNIDTNAIAEEPAPQEGINVDTNAIAEEPAPQEGVDIDTVEEQTNEVQEALAQVPELEDDEELSDDDLDMIEKLSKPNEEIEALNEQGVNNTEDDTSEEEVNVDTPAADEPTPQERVNVDTVTDVEETAPHEGVNVDAITDVEETAPQEGVNPEETPVDNTETSEPPAANDTAAEESITEEVAEAQEPPQEAEGLQTRANTTPSVPEYKADFPDEDRVNSDPIGQGDRVIHEEFGEGVVEKMINYGDKVLCSVNFASVGRRLLNPDISEMKKI